jgi:hypothetical protein
MVLQQELEQVLEQVLELEQQQPRGLAHQEQQKL